MSYLGSLAELRGSPLRADEPEALVIGRVRPSIRPVVAFVLSGGEDAFRANANRPPAIVTAVDTCPPPRDAGHERPAFIECRVDAPAAAVGVDVPGRRFVELCPQPPLAFIQPRRNRLGTCWLSTAREN